MRRRAALLVVSVVLTAAVSCRAPGGGADRPGPPGHGGGHALGTGNGYVDRHQWRAAQDGYLAFATEELTPTSPTNVLAHLTRAARDRSFTFDAAAIGPDEFAATFEKIDAFRDTSDFDMLRLVAIWEGHRHTIDPELRAAIEQRMSGFRYWYTDPLPVGVVDDKWFWSENHRIIFHTIEYLAGRALPEATFAITGEPGAVHAERGRARVEAWIDEKAAWGFSEWHSDVYYQEDIQALTLLAEHGELDVARKAAVVLDLFLYDLALHSLRGNNGVTHGRSYMKDKSRAVDQDVFGLTKLLFGTTDQPYTSRSDTGAAFLAAAERYRLPEVIRRVATTDRTFEDRTHMGAPLDLDEPFTTAPQSQVPGVSYDEPADIPFWWERGALTAWQTVPLTLATIDEHDLFETSLFRPFKPLVDITGGDPATARQLAYELRCMINIGVLSEVDTVTWRSPDAMLSSAQDYRPGCFGNQYHAWQATLDEDAVVFTTLPGNEPRPGDRWVDADLYWSGTGAMPRSAQSGPAAIHLYAPRFASPGPGPLAAFSYLPVTHAYFPTERFDEVRQVGGWTLGRSGDGYVALWSWRPTSWRAHDPAVTFTNGLTEPFDLVAEGGADNVWISEVGDAATWGSFDDFAAAVTAAPVTVARRPAGPNGLPGGFDVSYASPSSGAMAFGTTGAFTVDGTEVALRGDDRFANPFGTTPFGSPSVTIAESGATLTVDTDRWTRHTSSRHR
ncbi:MAG TPA: hypothetical protein VFY82_06180 [Acidimicrobiales bacterium]|nr:hypothetical protein [Acidimicrobiales bacterium]